MENYPFCEGNVTSLCKEGEVGKYVEFGVFVKNGKGKPPKKDTVGRIKRRMKCRSKRCPKNFIFGDEEDGDELVAASQVGHPLCGEINTLIVKNCLTFGVKATSNRCFSLGFLNFLNPNSKKVQSSC